MRYANPTTVYQLLGIDPDNPRPDESVLDVLEDVEAGIAANLDSRCNRTFGVEPVQVTREVAYSGNGYESVAYIDRIYIPESNLYFFTNSIVSLSPYSPYVFEYGVKNVTSVAVDGVWDGTVWGDETELDPEDWRLVFTRYDGWSMGILLPSFGYASVRVTGEWEDHSNSEDIPVDIQQAATMLTADQYRILKQSPNGELGPPGLVTYIRDTWEHETVKQAIVNHRVWPLVV